MWHVLGEGIEAVAARNNASAPAETGTRSLRREMQRSARRSCLDTGDFCASLQLQPPHFYTQEEVTYAQGRTELYRSLLALDEVQ